MLLQQQQSVADAARITGADEWLTDSPLRYRMRREK